MGLLGLLQHLIRLVAGRLTKDPRGKTAVTDIVLLELTQLHSSSNCLALKLKTLPLVMN